MARITNTLRGNMADEVLTAINGGFARAYSGTRPAGPSTAITDQVLLCEMELNDPAGANSNGVITVDIDPAVLDSSGNANGTPSFVRVFGSDGTTAWIDCSAGVGSGGSPEWEFSAAVAAGQPVTLDSASFTVPAGT